MRPLPRWFSSRALNGAAQESNLPSVGLRRRTGFEGLPGEAQSVMGGSALAFLELDDRPGRAAIPLIVICRCAVAHG